ncbi:MAG: trypsin-like peptidase domain-containing protein [Planctomycetota bacterium]
MKLLSILIFGVILGTLGVWADEIGQIARNILKANEKAVVRVSVVIKQSMSFGGQPARNRESKKEIIGTLIDPSGLTLVSLSRIDPGASLAGSESHGIEIKTELSSIKILLSDGKEVAAKVVLRDKDLDIAFVVPEQKLLENSFPFISLENKTKNPIEIMDEGIILTRAEKTAKRVSMVDVLRINAIVSKPRTFYLSQNIGSVGSPVFAKDGSLIGVTLIRINSSEGALEDVDAVYIILPVDEMNEVVKQAKEEMEKQWSVPTEEKKEEKEEK